MEEDRALLLASASLIGIFLISLCAENMEPALTELKDLSAWMLNEPVRVRGLVEEHRKMSSGVRLLLEQDGYTTYIVYFEEVETKKGMCAEAVGEVKTYEGGLEIVAEKLSVYIC